MATQIWGWVSAKIIAFVDHVLDDVRKYLRPHFRLSLLPVSGDRFDGIFITHCISQDLDRQTLHQREQCRYGQGETTFAMR